MKRFFGVVLVLLVLGVVGCAQIDPAKTKEVPLVSATKITVYIAANATVSGTLPGGDNVVWAVGELGTALGGTIEFWGARAKALGSYGTALTAVATDFSGASQWGNADKLDFKFVITADNSAPAGGVEINDGGNNFSVELTKPLIYQGTTFSTGNPGVTYKWE
jgi:hypothetical protein